MGKPSENGVFTQKNRDNGDLTGENYEKPGENDDSARKILDLEPI